MSRASDTRSRLLDAALRLLWDEGLGAASVDAICRLAGVRRGSFYHFFESKTALVISALEENFEEVRRELDGVFSASRPPIERLRAFAGFSHARQVARREQAGRVVGCPYASVGCSCSQEEAAIQAKVREILATCRRYVASAIREGAADGSIPVRDVEFAASSVMDYVEGALAAARIQDDLRPIENLGRGIFTLLGLEWEVPRCTDRSTRKMVVRP